MIGKQRKTAGQRDGRHRLRTGRTVVLDDTTGEVIHVGGDSEVRCIAEFRDGRQILVARSWVLESSRNA